MDKCLAEQVAAGANVAAFPLLAAAFVLANLAAASPSDDDVPLFAVCCLYRSLTTRVAAISAEVHRSVCKTSIGSILMGVP
jgi:hypothetical protein